MPRDEDTPDAFTPRGHARRECRQAAPGGAGACMRRNGGAREPRARLAGSRGRGLVDPGAHRRTTAPGGSGKLEGDVGRGGPASGRRCRRPTLTEGGVDVEWFRQATASSARERWRRARRRGEVRRERARGTRAGAALRRARWPGCVTAERAVRRGIEASRHQDAVRALGLLPLAEGEARHADLLSATSGCRSSAAGAAVRLAAAAERGTRRRDRAGEPGPHRRLPRPAAAAMGDGAGSVADLARGAGRARARRRDAHARDRRRRRAELSVAKGEAAQDRSRPRSRRTPEVEALKDRLQELKRQRSRVRDALEEAMCRGDRLHRRASCASCSRIRCWRRLSRLVFVGEGHRGLSGRRGARRCATTPARAQPIGSDRGAAHRPPARPARAGDWARGSASASRRAGAAVQAGVPRAVPVTDAERRRRRRPHGATPASRSTRRRRWRCSAARGWVAQPEEGVSRTFHDDGLTARLGFQEAFYTPGRHRRADARGRRVHAEGRVIQAAAARRRSRRGSSAR